MLSRHLHLILLYLAYSLIQLLVGCASLPSREAVLRETVYGSSIPKIKDAEGPYGKQGSERIPEHKAGDDDAEHLKRFIQAEQAITGSPFIASNRITLLVDGPEIFEAMLDAIREAKDHIHLETYWLDDDQIGYRFADLLIRRSTAGVKVRLIYDGIGSFNSSDKYFERLRAGGVEVHEFHPVEDPRLWQLTHRDHRKLLIVDGKITFTGGINISDVYSGGSPPINTEERDTESRWRETDVRIEGPAVAKFQKLFLRIWAEEEGEDLLGEPNLFPQLDNAGQELVRVVASTGGEDEYEIYKMYIAAISLARKSVWVTQAYFSPNDHFIDALKEAARRGIDVRILLPSFSDHKIVLYASHARYTELLEAGVRLYEREDRLLHAKTAVIDGLWSTVGSSNLDYQSFLHNNEVNAVILGYNFGRQMEELFLSDLGHSKQIGLEEWKKRPLWERFMEMISSLFKYWL